MKNVRNVISYYHLLQSPIFWQIKWSIGGNLKSILQCFQLKIGMSGAWQKQNHVRVGGRKRPEVTLSRHTSVSQRLIVGENWCFQPWYGCQHRVQLLYYSSNQWQDCPSFSWLTSQIIIETDFMVYNQIFVIGMMSIMADIIDIMTSNDEDLLDLGHFKISHILCYSFSINKEWPRNFELFPRNYCWQHQQQI